MIADFITSLGLDFSFFYQLALAVLLYFASKKIVFEPYLKSFQQRQERTKGRLKTSRDLEQKIEQSRKIYEDTARQNHKEFQETFGRLKEKARASALKESERLHREQKELMGVSKDSLQREVKKQDLLLEKDLPVLTKLLVDKIKD